ncbi:hypothetical protein ACJJTC_007520 [Scirpophaga incertulas]
MAACCHFLKKERSRLAGVPARAQTSPVFMAPGLTRAVVPPRALTSDDEMTGLKFNIVTVTNYDKTVITNQAGLDDPAKNNQGIKASCNVGARNADRPNNIT